MRRKPPYTQCRLYVDNALGFLEGHYITTRGGSAYLITAQRLSKTVRFRKHFTCLRWPIEEIPADAKVHEIQWYRRKPKTRRLSELGHPPT